jgi:hypothetical protein
MKTAIFYSGQARTFNSCWPNHFWYVLRHFPNPHIFASVCDDSEAKSMERLRERFKSVSIEHVKQPDFQDADAVAKKATHSGYIIVVKPQNVFRAFWHLKKAWGMLPEGQEFDIYVRIRPDIWFQEFERPQLEFLNRWECWTPPWGSYGGINDRFAVMGHDAAVRYFNAFDHIGELLDAGCPFHPETLSRAALEQDGIARPVPRLVTDFKIRRLADAEHGGREWLVAEPFLGIEILRAALTKP